MNTINTSILLKPITKLRDPFWRKRRQHSIIPDKKKQEDKKKCRVKYVYHSSNRR